MTVDDLDPTDPEVEHERAIGELRRMLRADQVLTDAVSLDAYAHDDAEWAPYTPPLAVVLAEREQDVSAVVRLAAASGLRVVPRGAGTGLSGGANAMARSIVLSLERMTRIVEVNAAEPTWSSRRASSRHAAGGRRGARPLVPARPRELPHRPSAATSRPTLAAPAA